MKYLKSIILLAIVLTIGLSAHAGRDQVITYNQLPQAAQTLLKKHFANKVPMMVTQDWDDYNIYYDSGEKVEFDKQGNWKDIECYSSGVPAELVPQQIKQHVKTSFPGATIIKLERNRLGWEVQLNNGLEIEYNRSFQAIDIDD